MRTVYYGWLTLWILLASSAAALAQPAPAPVCPRPAAGSEVPEPEDLRSKNGVLTVDLTYRNYQDSEGRTRYCYV